MSGDSSYRLYEPMRGDDGNMYRDDGSTELPSATSTSTSYATTPSNTRVGYGTDRFASPSTTDGQHSNIRRRSSDQWRVGGNSEGEAPTSAFLGDMDDDWLMLDEEGGPSLVRNLASDSSVALSESSSLLDDTPTKRATADTPLLPNRTKRSRLSCCWLL
jgi:hypothetical protein